METATVTESSICLPGRPWLIAGAGAPCLISIQGLTLIPIFRTAEATRRFMERGGVELSSAFYPQFPNEEQFVALLGVGMHNGAEGYILIDPDRWYVIGFAEISRNSAMPSDAICSNASRES